MATAQVLMQMFANMGGQIPVLVTWVMGAIFALVYWQENRRAAVLVLISCLLCLLNAFAFGFIYVALAPVVHANRSLGSMGVQAIYLGLGFIQSGLSVVAWILVPVAVFRRSPPPLPASDTLTR